MITTTDAYYVTGTQLLACLQVQAEAAVNPPKNFQFLPGSVATADISQYNDLCCEGTAYVRMAAQYPSGTQFPSPDTTASNCDPFSWGVIFELGIMRCSPMGDVQAIPTSAEWHDVFAQQAIDAHSMRAAICCWISSYRSPGAGVQIGQWAPVGPEGGCMIGTLSVTLEMILCSGCG
jgi:hypothetical protein